MATIDKITRLCALFFSICASAAVLIFALARHNAPNNSGELYNIVAQQMLFHAFLGLIICAFWEKFGRFYFFPIAFCIAGILLFCIPVILRINGITEHSPSAPFGGFAFALAWLSAGISIFMGQKTK